MDDTDRKTPEYIDKFGCSVMHIAAEDDLPPFSYSVGIQRTSGAPEVVLIGLQRELAHSVINQYNDRVRAGEKFLPGQGYAGFLGGFDVIFKKVDTAYYDEYFGVAL